MSDCAERHRLAHRLRDIQTLPYVVVANPHLAHVYESYLRAFERFRRMAEIRTLEDNEKYCKVLEETLTEHATVIPRLAIGVLEVRGLMKPEETDKFMTTMLRSVGTSSALHRRMLILAAHIATRHCRAASGTHRNLQLAMALSKRPAAARPRSSRRDLPALQCQGNCGRVR
jgi:hypothetical protein